MGKEKTKEMLFWTKDEYLQFADAMMDKPIPFYGELKRLEHYSDAQDELMLTLRLVAETLGGIFLWGYPVRKGTVLYLALEDDYGRLQKRLSRMFGTDSIDNLYFATPAKMLGGGLDGQLNAFVREHPDARLIIPN